MRRSRRRRRRSKPTPSRLADEEEAVDAGVEQEHLVEDGEVRGPGGLEPAQVDGEAEGEEDQEVAPVAGLVWVGLSRPDA